jgi:hypothetical protein
VAAKEGGPEVDGIRVGEPEGDDADDRRVTLTTADGAWRHYSGLLS